MNDSDKADIRAFGAKCDGKTDDSDAIQKALNQVPLNADHVKKDSQVVVYFPPLRAGIAKELRVVSPGTILQGEGLCGGDNLQGCNAVSTLVALPGFQGDAAINMGPKNVNAFWGLAGWNGLSEVRGICARFLCIDLTQVPSIRAFEVRSLSNCPPWESCSMIGGTGSGFDFAGEQVTDAPYSLPCEGIVLRNCYVYGGMSSEGGSMGLEQTAPMVRFAGCNEVKVDGGKFLYDFPNAQSPQPAVLIESEILFRNPQESSLPALSSAVHFTDVSTGNSRVHYRIRGVTFNGQHYRPSSVSLDHCTLEGYNRAFEANQEPQEPGVDWLSWMSKNLRMDGTNCLKTVFGDDAYSALVDYAIGGEFSFDNLGSGSGLAGAKFGKSYVWGLDVNGGLNPNTLGQQPNLQIDYARNRVVFTKWQA